MGWVGKLEMSRRLRSGDVRLGDYVLPIAAVWRLLGDNGEPDVEVRLEVRNGRPQCVEVIAKAKPDGRPVRTSDLQMLQLDAITTRTFAHLATRTTYDPETGATMIEPIGSEREFWEAVNVTDAAVKAPRRGSTLAELEQVARVYRESIDSHPVKEVTVALGYGSERTAARRVEQARAAGLLPPTSPGKKKA